jgi:hypothetical protein
MWLWSKDSPNKHQLLLNNIHPVRDQPAFSKESLIIEEKRVFQDMKEIHTNLVYNETIEHQYFKGSHKEWSLTTFQGIFTTMPSTTFKENEFDNSLSKMYLMHLDWTGQTVPRPTASDTVKYQLPFEVPECPEYTVQTNKGGTFRDDFDHSDSDHEVERGRTWHGQDFDAIAEQQRADAAVLALLRETEQLQNLEVYTSKGMVPVIIDCPGNFRH